jgi:hypothetical protein
MPDQAVEIGNTLKYRVNVQEVLVEDKVSYTYDELEFPAGTPKEICEVKAARYEAKAKQADAQKYLSDTDWVVVKISEATLVGEDVESLKTKYAEVIAKRVEARLNA